MYTKILLPLDASGVPEGVVGHAIALAKNMGASVLGLRVIPIVETGETFFERIQVEIGSYGARRRDEALTHLQELGEQFGEAGVPFTGETLFSGKSEADAITNYARDKGCDLIVLPSLNQSSFSRWLMGNVVDKVCRRSTVPVLLVKADTLGR